jgi:hypothetical protein
VITTLDHHVAMILATSVCWLAAAATARAPSDPTPVSCSEYIAHQSPRHQRGTFIHACRKASSPAVITCSHFPHSYSLPILCCSCTHTATPHHTEHHTHHDAPHCTCGPMVERATTRPPTTSNLTHTHTRAPPARVAHGKASTALPTTAGQCRSATSRSKRGALAVLGPRTTATALLAPMGGPHKTSLVSCSSPSRRDRVVS